MMLLIQLIGVALALFYFFVKRKLTYWERLGVPHIKPEFFFGNTKGIDTSYHHSEFWRKMYLELKGKGPVAGVYVYTEPVAMVTDLDLAKRVFVKDFDFFCNRGGYLNEKNDPGTAHIVNLEDDKWRTMRNRISPFFVTGKLKTYFPRIADLADLFTERIAVEEDLEMRELVSRLVVDVLGRVLFSREFNQLKELKTDVSEIVCQTQRGITFTSKTLGEIYRWLLADILAVKVIPTKTVAFLEKTLRESMEKDEKPNEDLADLLGGYYNKNEIRFTDVWANAGAVFVAGHDNLSSSIRHTIYELSKRPDLQDRCRKSIQEVLKKHNNELTYEAIMEMTYLEQCIFETFRIHVVSIFTRRMAKYDYKVPGTDITIEKGTMVQVPVFGIHNDPEIYPNPSVWDPDRMAPEEVRKRHLFAFTPFGMGPHQCIGFRLGLLTGKTTLVKTILKYTFELDRTKTPDKLTYNPKRLFMTTEGTDDIYMKFTKIKA